MTDHADGDEPDDQGLTVGRYKIIGEIGRGGMGVVYLARQSDLDRLVALKAVHGLHANAGDFAKRFTRESRLAGSLNHHNIVTVYEYVEADQTPYIAMEYVARGSLRQWVGRLSLAQLGGVLEGLLAGLSAVEPAEIVHRDLKPENVLVTADGHVKIADFGIARASEHASASQTGELISGATMGTPAYMAPEQALAQEIGPWTDLYSLGIIAYEQLIGHVPFHDDDSLAMLIRHINESIPAVTDSRPDVDQGLSDWISRLVANDPADRPAGAMQAWEELEEILIGLLGARWRRAARLLSSGQSADHVELPTPRQFESRQISVPISVPAAPGYPSPSGSPGEPDSPGGAGPPGAGEAARARTAAPTRQPRDRRPRVLLRLAIGLVAMAGLSALAGYLAARTSRHVHAPPAFVASASTAVFEVSLPDGWRRGDAIPTALRTLGLSEVIALSSSPAKGGLILGIARTSSTTLLPAALTSSLPSPARRESIQLGPGAYYRYRDLQLDGSGMRTSVYAQPTTAGVVLAACELPSRSPAATDEECERILGTLRLAQAQGLKPGPSPRYAKQLRSTLVGLEAARNIGMAALRKATTAAAQGAAAASLARAYGQAADSLPAPGPAESLTARELAQALLRAQSGYSLIASGAHTEDEVEFDRGRATAATAAREIAAYVGQLSRLGYPIAH